MSAPVSRHRAREYVSAGGVVGVATGLCLMLRTRLEPIDVAMVLLAGVVAVAARYRRGPALFASILSIAAFNFLFVPPYYTFSVHDTSYFLTFGVMLVVALTMSRLTARIREQREAAAEREQRTAALYAMQRDLAAASDTPAMVDAAVRHMGAAAGGKATIRLTDAKGLDGSDPVWPEDTLFASAEIRIAATLALSHGKPAGWGSATAPDAEALLIPLRGTSETLGLVAIRPNDPDHDLRDFTRDMLSAMADQAGAALERRLLAERSEHARAEVEAERLRTALLSSLSHDLRTPLAGIEGAASGLLDGAGALSAADRSELAESILEESRRMTRLVTNLLNMIRVETGALAVQKSWQPLEEPLGVALLRMEERLREHPVTTQLPEDLPLVPVDELLIEQVFINLMENAARYTPAGTPIEISARAEGRTLLVEVADRGPGVPIGEEEAVFGRFYRATGESADAGAGSGLGLTICRGIIAAHGGRIWMERRTDGGAVVRFTLPLAGPLVNAVPVDAEGI
jgi:two-component system, OmpR family, sensor histidine kinase KdpD